MKSLRRFFARERANHRDLLAPDGSLRVAPATPQPHRTLRAAAQRAPRGSRMAGALLALFAGAAIALVAVVAMQDPRSLGTQIDAAVASVKNIGTRAGRTVVDSQNAAAEASRNALDGVSTALDDAGTSAKVKAALAVDPALSAARIEVSTDNGIVHLDGPAPNAAAKARASVLAAAPQGVRGVDNRLALPQPGNVVATAATAPQTPQPR